MIREEVILTKADKLLSPAVLKHVLTYDRMGENTVYYEWSGSYCKMGDRIVLRERNFQDGDTIGIYVDGENEQAFYDTLIELLEATPIKKEVKPITSVKRNYVDTLEHYRQPGMFFEDEFAYYILMDSIYLKGMGRENDYLYLTAFNTNNDVIHTFRVNPANKYVYEGNDDRRVCTYLGKEENNYIFMDDKSGETYKSAHAILSVLMKEVEIRDKVTLVFLRDEIIYALSSKQKDFMSMFEVVSVCEDSRCTFVKAKLLKGSVHVNDTFMVHSYADFMRKYDMEIVDLYVGEKSVSSVCEELTEFTFTFSAKDKTQEKTLSAGDKFVHLDCMEKSVSKKEEFTKAEDKLLHGISESEEMEVVSSMKDALYKGNIFKMDKNHRAITGYFGNLKTFIDTKKQERSLIPFKEDTGPMVKGFAILAVCVVFALLLLFHPGIKTFFAGDTISIWVTVILMIVALFTTGSWWGFFGAFLVCAVIFGVAEKFATADTFIRYALVLVTLGLGGYQGYLAYEVYAAINTSAYKNRDTLIEEYKDAVLYEYNKVKKIDGKIDALLNKWKTKEKTLYQNGISKETYKGVLYSTQDQKEYKSVKKMLCQLSLLQMYYKNAVAELKLMLQHFD